MTRETVKEAQKIIERIKANRFAISELEKYTESGKTLFAFEENYPCITGERGRRCVEIYFEPWEIRLMIHNKKQRIVALERQLEQL